MPQLHLSGPDDKPDEHDANSRADITDAHHPGAIDSVCQHPAKGQKQKARQKGKEDDQREARAGMGRLKDVDTQGKSGQPASDRRQKPLGPDDEKLQAVHPFLFVLRDPALPPQHLPQLFQGSLLWIVCQCLICGSEPIDHSLDESFQNLFFRLEVVVERSFRYASFQDDGVHGCMDIALLPEKLSGCFEYLGAAGHGSLTMRLMIASFWKMDGSWL